MVSGEYGFENGENQSVKRLQRAAAGGRSNSSDGWEVMVRTVKDAGLELKPGLGYFTLSVTLASIPVTG